MSDKCSVQFRATRIARELSGETEDKRRLEYLQSIPLKDALELISSNEIDSVRFDAMIFGMGENSHDIRPEPGSEDALVRSFEGVPFMFDHNLSMDSKKGRLENPKRRGKTPEEFEATVVLVDPSAMEDAVRGKIEQFSAGVTGSSWYCSVCNADWEHWWMFYMPSCEHKLGEKYVTDDDTIVKAEAFIRDPVGYECSAVWKGAYPGTGILFSEMDPGMQRKFMEFVMREKGKGEEKDVGLSLEEGADGAGHEAEGEEHEEGQVAEPESAEAEAEGRVSVENSVKQQNAALVKKLFEAQFSLAVRDGKVTEKHRAFFQKWTSKVGIELFEEFTAISGGGAAKLQTEFAGTGAANANSAIPAGKTKSLTERVKARRAAKGGE